MVKNLTECGWFVGVRDPKRNTDFEGVYMVCEDLSEGPSEDARNGGFCIVGNDLAVLVEEAYSTLTAGQIENWKA